MRKIRMLVSMAGPDESWTPGDEREVEDYIADEWCKPEVAFAEPATEASIPPAATDPSVGTPSRRKKTGDS